MASPQKENGYTPISNEILENICKFKFNGSQYSILLTIWRYTYGFNRKNHSFSLTFICNATGIHKVTASKELSKLIDAKVLTIIQTYDFSNSRVIQFNKHYDEWLIPNISSKPIDLQLVNTLTVSQSANTPVSQSANTPVSQSANTPVSQSANTPVSQSANQERQLKENTKERLKTNILCNDVAPQTFFESLWSLYPHKVGKSAVSKKSIKALEKIGIERLSDAIAKYKSQKPEWQEYMNGSTFFNGRYLDYLEPEKTEEQKKEIEQNKIRYQEMRGE